MPHEYGKYAASSTAHLPHDISAISRHICRVSKPIEILQKRIAAKIAELGLSEREVSMEATGKEYTVRYIRTRDTMPSGDKLERLADYLGTTVDWLLGKTDVQPVNAGAISPVISSEQFRRLPRDLPVYGTALGADLDLLTVAGESLGVEQIDVNLAAPTDHMARPLGAVGRNMYVVQIVGHSMEPRIDAGRRVLVDGSRAGRKGEDVVVQLRRMVGDHEEIYAVMVKQLVRQKSGSFVFHQFTPDVDFEIPVEVVAAVHPIIPWEDVLGF